MTEAERAREWLGQAWVSKVTQAGDPEVSVIGGAVDEKQPPSTERQELIAIAAALGYPVEAVDSRGVLSEAVRTLVVDYKQLAADADVAADVEGGL